MKPNFMEEQIWKQITGYEGIYNISSFGKVKSLSRPNNLGYMKYERNLTKSLGSHGYYAVTLSKDGKGKSCTMHSLVAAAFIGPRPFGYVIDHLDNDRTNNYYKNLEYITQKENVRRGQLCALSTRKRARLDAEMTDEEFEAMLDREYG